MILNLQREDIEKVVKWCRMYIDYKERKGFETPLRYAFFRAGSKKACKEWKDEKFMLQDLDKIEDYITENLIVSISQTLLPNEIVLESDNYSETGAYSYNVLFDLLKTFELKHYVVFSGNASLHVHILFDRPPTPKEKDFIKSFFAKRIDGLDGHGFSINHPWRIPETYHPVTLQKASLVIFHEFTADFWDKLKLNQKLYTRSFMIELENDLDLFLRRIGYQEESESRVKRKKVIIIEKGRGKKYRKLPTLYERILQTKILDGRDRVLLILLTLAKKLGISPEKFSEDLRNWVSLCEWKERYWRNWSRYYTEDKYPWMKNWRWAIREFWYAEDIERSEKEKIKRVLEEVLGDWLEDILKRQEK